MFEAQINRGTIWLNALRPMWFQDINCEVLRMSNPDNCIVGQLKLSGAMVPDANGLLWQSEFAMNHGFDITLTSTLDIAYGLYDVLAAEWCRVIKEMRDYETVGTTQPTL